MCGSRDRVISCRNQSRNLCERVDEGERGLGDEEERGLRADSGSRNYSGDTRVDGGRGALCGRGDCQRRDWNCGDYTDGGGRRGVDRALVEVSPEDGRGRGGGVDPGNGAEVYGCRSGIFDEPGAKPEDSGICDAEGYVHAAGSVDANGSD